MKIVSWNIQGGGSKGEYHKHLGNKATELELASIKSNINQICKKLLESNADIIFIQEFQYQYIQYFSELIEKYEYVNFDEQLKVYTARNGVLTLSKKVISTVDFNCTLKSYHKRNFQYLSVDDHVFLCVHIPVTKDDRGQYLENIVRFSKEHRVKTFILGDFNTLKSEKNAMFADDNIWIDCNEERKNTSVYKTRIDHIYHAEDVQMDSFLIHEDKDYSLSDHNALEACF